MYWPHQHEAGRYMKEGTTGRHHVLQECDIKDCTTSILLFCTSTWCKRHCEPPTQSNASAHTCSNEGAIVQLPEVAQVERAV